jgi:hypothetical protein
MNLYEIDKAILACIDPETGELLDEAALEDLQMERTQKIKNVALWLKNLNASAAAYKAERDAFDERMKQAQKKAESLKRYLADALGGEKFVTDECAVSFRRSAAVTVFDEAALPAEYVAEKISKTPDKAAIKAAIKSGIEVPGAALVDNLSVNVK